VKRLFNRLVLESTFEEGKGKNDVKVTPLYDMTRKASGHYSNLKMRKRRGGVNAIKNTLETDGHLTN